MSVVAEIATKITMADGVSAVLAGIAKQTLHLEGSVMKLEKTFAGLNRTALAIVGSLAAIGGATVLGALKNVADHGDKLLNQQDQLRRAGIAHNEVLKVQAKYYEQIAKTIPTSTAADYLRVYGELRSVVGADKAEAKTPWALKLEALMSNMSGKSSEKEGFKILRALEMKGITLSDPAQADKLAELMMKNIVGSGGKLSASDFEAMAKTGGVAWIKSSPRFIGTSLSNVASDLGGDRTGTTLMSFNQLLTGATKMGNAQFEEFNKLGLLNLKQVGWNKKLDQPIMQVDSIKGAALAMSDPDLWVQQMVLPALERVYGNDQTKREQSLAILGRNRNTRRMLTMFADPGFREQMAKDSALWAQAKGVEPAYADFISTNPAGVKAAFHSQYESMMQAIGAPLMMAALPVMKAVTELFTKIGAWANQNPAAITVWGEFFAKVGAALLASGTISVLMAVASFLGAGGALIVGFTALRAILEALSKLNWPGFTSAFKGFGEAVIKISGIGFDVIKIGFEALVGVLKILPGVANDVATAFGKLGDWLKGLIDKILGWVGLGGASGGGSYADSAARMRNMNVGSAGGVMSRVGGGKLGFSPQGPIGPTSSYSGESHPLFASIIRAEGTAKHGDPYQTSLGYMRPPKPLTEMTMAESLAWGDRVRAAQGLNSSAKGAFQIVNSTQRKAMAALHLTGSDMFSRENQRKLAWWIAQHQGLGAWEGFKRHPGELSSARRGLQGGYTPGPPPAKREDRSQMRPIILQVNGRTFASIASQEIARLHTHHTHAPYASRSTFLQPGHQFQPG